MFKKIILALILLCGISVSAAENYLNSVVIDNIEGKESIIFRSDAVAKMKREIESSDKIVITLKGMKQSPDINTLYKNISNINGLIIQNEGNELKIYVDAPNIAKANIVFETPNSAPITVADTKSRDFKVWSLISVAILMFIIKTSKIAVANKPSKDINDIIRDREKELYRNFQKEVATLPSINYKLKGYRKHVLKGETIRSYESRLSKI